MSTDESARAGRVHPIFEEILKPFFQPAPRVPEGLTGERLARWLREQGFDARVVSAPQNVEHGGDVEVCEAVSRSAEEQTRD